MKKRMVAAALAGAMVLGLTGITAQAEGTLRMTWLGAGDDKAWLDECLQGFKDETGYEVEVVYIPGNWAEYFTKIQTMVAGGDIIDTAYIAIEGFEIFRDTGLALPIGDQLDPEILNDVSESALDKFIFDDQVLGVPFEWNTTLVQINKNCLEAAGLEVPDKEWTKDEFLSYCEKLTYEENGVKKYGFCVPTDYFALNALLFQNNAAVMTDDFTEATINSPEAVEVFQFLQDLIYEYGYSPIPSGIKTTDSFCSGDIAMYCAGRWSTVTYEGNDFRDVAIAYMPSFAQNLPVWGGAGIFVFKDSENIDAAIELANYMGNKDFISKFMSYGAVPVLDSVAQDTVESLGYPDNREIYYEAAANTKAVQSPAQYAECSEIVLRAASEIFVNDADVQSTLDMAAMELDSVLAENR